MQYRGKIVTVIGLGTTGLSCIDFLLAKQANVRAIDTRPKVSGSDKLAKSIPLHLGSINQQWLLESDLIVISPGISVKHDEIQQAILAGIKVVGDIELFCQEAKAPIIAITGSNGKSTVTTLVTEMAHQAGIKVGMGGNIGVPALSLLNGGYELYVLELSSFQLETTYSLKAKVATVLNVTEDHMDRYDSMADYRQAKLRIYHHAECIVANKEDCLTFPQQVVRNLTFFAEESAPYHLKNGILMSADEPILAVSEMQITGRHNEMNALAAIALAEKAGIGRQGIIDGLKNYVGLAHRFQLIPTNDGVYWINDSKATNVGSTVAALQGLAVKGTLHLLLGGEGKGADFSDLKPLVDQPHIICYCFGKDGKTLAQLSTQSVLLETMQQAIEIIRPKLKIGDMVLLSPACASLDQYPNFEVRGKIFAELALGKDNAN